MLSYPFSRTTQNSQPSIPNFKASYQVLPPMKIKLVTWNVNSIRTRVDLIARFVEAEKPDIFCLQEIKCTNDQFPHQAVSEMGFGHTEIQGQKAYHGVATLSKVPLKRLDCHDFDGTGQARHLAVEIGIGTRTKKPVVLHNFYVPAGGDVADEDENPKFKCKMTYLREMEKHFTKIAKKDADHHKILVGDLNIAPLETDVWSHKQLLKVVSHTPVEVEALGKVQQSYNWLDMMRHHIPPEERLYSWWSYRSKDWRKNNRGRRLDHIWLSPTMKPASQALKVYETARDWTRPSDHAPVIAELDLDLV